MGVRTSTMTLVIGIYPMFSILVICLLVVQTSIGIYPIGKLAIIGGLRISTTMCMDRVMMITYICLKAVIRFNTTIRGVINIRITTFMLDHPWKKKNLHRVNLLELIQINSIKFSLCKYIDKCSFANNSLLNYSLLVRSLGLIVIVILILGFGLG